MARRSEVWYWTERKCWASTINGKKTPLGRGTKAEAQQELYRLLSNPPSDTRPTTEGISVKELIHRFNDAASAAIAPATLVLYERRLTQFGNHCGSMLASSVKPFHLTEWLATKNWSDTTKRTAAAIIKRAFAWGLKQGYLDRDPTTGFEKHPDARREVIPTEAQIKAVLAVAESKAFREFLLAVWKTGCRPGEAAKVTARDFDPVARTWTIQGKTSRKTGRKRVVYLPPEIVSLCERLAVEHPSGPLFRNSYGDPWSENAHSEYLRKIREDHPKLGLGEEVVFAGLRHLFTTDALDREIPIATVAELLGHTSTAMVSKHYSHLSDRASHLREAVEKIRPSSPSQKVVASECKEGDEEQPQPSPSAPADTHPRKRRGRKP